MMKRGLTPVVLMWLAFSGCSDPDRDLPRDYRTLPVPVEQLRAQAVQQRGRALFLEHCALCHGVRGDGHGERRQGLDRPLPDFASVTWRRQATPRGTYYAIRAGVRGTAMPAWKALDPAQTWDIVAYVLSIGEERR